MKTPQEKIGFLAQFCRTTRGWHGNEFLYHVFFANDKICAGDSHVLVMMPKFDYEGIVDYTEKTKGILIPSRSDNHFQIIPETFIASFNSWPQTNKIKCDACEGKKK